MVISNKGVYIEARLTNGLLEVVVNPTVHPDTLCSFTKMCIFMTLTTLPFERMLRAFLHGQANRPSSGMPNFNAELFHHVGHQYTKYD